MLNGKKLLPFSLHLKLELEERNVKSPLRTRTSTTAIGRVIKLWWNREQMDGHSIECAALVCKNPFTRQYVFSPAEDPPPSPSPPLRVSRGLKQISELKQPFIKQQSKNCRYTVSFYQNFNGWWWIFEVKSDLKCSAQLTDAVAPEECISLRWREASGKTWLSVIIWWEEAKTRCCILPRNGNINTACCCRCSIDFSYIS